MFVTSKVGRPNMPEPTSWMPCAVAAEFNRTRAKAAAPPEHTCAVQVPTLTARSSPPSPSTSPNTAKDRPMNELDDAKNV